MKHIISVSFSRTKAYESHKEFLNKFLHVSFGHYLPLTEKYDVHVCNNATFEGEFYDHGIKWHYANLHSPVALFKLVNYYRNKEAVFLIHGFHTPLHVLFLKLFHSPSRLVVLHHAERPAKHPLKRSLQRKAFYNLKALFVSEDQARTFYSRRVLTPGNIKEVMECSTNFKPTSPLHFKGKWKCLWVGRLDHNKDPLTVIRAVALLKTRGVEMHLQMVYSSGRLEPIVLKTIQELGLSSYITLRGHKTHKQLENMYRESHLFIAASHYEGSGVAACEAMACGCVPILTNIPSFKKMTRNGEGGFLYEPSQYMQLFEIISNLTEEEWLSKRSKALSIFEEDLSFKAIKTRYEEILEEAFV